MLLNSYYRYLCNGNFIHTGNIYICISYLNIEHTHNVHSHKPFYINITHRNLYIYIFVLGIFLNLQLIKKKFEKY